MKLHLAHTLFFLLAGLFFVGCDATMPTAALDEAEPVAFTEAPHATASKTGTTGEGDTRKAVVWCRISGSAWGRITEGGWGRITEGSWGRITDGSWGRIGDVSFGGTTEKGHSITGTGVVKRAELDHIGNYNFTVEIEGTLAGRAIRGEGAFSVPSSSAASPDGDGEVDGADFLMWQQVVLSIDVEASIDGNDW